MTTTAPRLPHPQARRPAGRSPHRPRLRLTPPHQFAQLLLLVLSGQRPAHSLLTHTRGPAFGQVTALAHGVPLRPQGADRRAAVLASVHDQRPCTGVIEVCARIRAGGRDRALAFRLEHGPDARWRCAAVRLG